MALDAIFWRAHAFFLQAGISLALDAKARRAPSLWLVAFPTARLAENAVYRLKSLWKRRGQLAREGKEIQRRTRLSPALPLSSHQISLAYERPAEAASQNLRHQSLVCRTLGRLSA
jgi:hypothetical protein